MSMNANIVAPLPTLPSATQICCDTKMGPQEKTAEVQDRGEKGSPLQVLGPSLNSSFSLRRNSAFSIYEPNIEQDNLKNESESQSSSFSSEAPDHQPKRVWKRQKKDKRELSRVETKNLNRYFRSKINEMLRDIKENPRNECQLKKAESVLEVLNKSNKIMFSEIREIIKDEWLNEKLVSCSGVLLKYIHGGKMGMQSKLIMLKYFNKIMKAIRNPDNFTCWK